MFGLRNTIIDYCANIGKDPMLVQGAGGNVSWKEGNILWVKASGTWLVDSKSKDIFLPVDLSLLEKAFKIDDFSVTPVVMCESLLKPSIETLLHALMPHKVVVHIHAIELLTYLVRDNPALEIEKKLKISTAWEVINYQKPGEELAKIVAHKISENPDIQVLLLKNHGVVIGGADIAEISKILTQLREALSAKIIINKISKEFPKPIVINNEQQYIPIPILEVHDFGKSTKLYSRIKTNWALYPDHIVFLGAKPNCYDSVDKLLLDLKGNQQLPELIFVKDMGVFSTTNLVLQN